MRLRWLLVVAALGCDSNPKPAGSPDLATPATNPLAASCDLRASSYYCSDYVFTSQAAADAAKPAFKSGCTSPGVYADAPCSHTGSLGGCGTKTNDFTSVNWFYTGGLYANAAAVMAACTSSTSGNTYFAP
jgi:hypothetical protein